MSETRPKRKSTGELIAPLTRYQGRAEEGAQWGALEEARLAGDADAERAASEKLARRLAMTGRDWDVAVGLAYRALSLGATKELRQELASWLELLGDHSLAAAERRKAALGSPEAPAMRRVALLHVRAEDAEGARAALLAAIAADPKDAVASELEGSLHAWSPDVVSAEDAVSAFLEGALRRQALGQSEAELDDLARAFDAVPSSVGAAMGLAYALRRADRARAADEIVRIHAVALLRKGERAASVALVTSEVQKKLEAGDLPAALGWMLDAESDAVVVGAEARQFDDLLLRAGLLEAVAIRLEQRAKEQRGEERASTLVELARVVSGALADASRAFDAYAGALQAAPSEAVFSAIEDLARTDLDTRFEDALTSAIANQELDAPLRLECARKLAARAEERDLPEMRVFALERMAELDASSPAAAQRDTVSDRLRSRREEREGILAALDAAGSAERAALIVPALASLRGVPGEEGRRARLFKELAHHSPRDRAVRERAVYALVRGGDFDGAVELAAEVPESAPEFVQFMFLAARLREARGDTTAALERLMHALTRATPSERLASFAWILAARAGDSVRRARSLAVLSSLATPEVSWVLAATAGEQLGEHGEKKLARTTLDAFRGLAASHPRLARAVVGVADEEDSTTAELVEGLVPNRRNLAFLARSRRASGDSVGALRAAAKLVAFRPGCQEAVELFADCLLATGEGSRIVDGLGWMLAQPLPAKTLAEIVARALHAARDLGAAKLVLVARRSLDTLGPRSAALKDAVFSVAQRSKDDALAADLLERWAASGAPAGERPDTYLAVAECKRRAGDPNEEARALVRALRSGAAADAVRPAIAAFDRTKLSSDGLLSFFEAKTLLAESGKKTELVRALREYGAALWDLAGDRARALDAWSMAARAAPYRAYTALSTDVVAFAGQGEALRLIEALVNRESDRARSGALAAEAARIALDAKQPDRAMSLARIALERDPEHAESLCVAEEAAVTVGRFDDLSALYDFVAARALGRFGRRAAHFRGARFFEMRRAARLSMRHAAQAFAAVPSEGGYALLSRAAAESGDRMQAARAVETAADTQRHTRVRAAWLVRAADLAGDDDEGLRQRLDLLLRAVIVAEDREHLARLATAARALLVKSPDDRDVVAMRLERAAKSLSKRMEGPEGARMALTFAELAVELEDNVERAWEHASRAMALDADVDEYARLEPASRRLATSDTAAMRVTQMLDEAERPLANVGKAALGWLVTIARERGGDLQTRAERLLERRRNASVAPPDDEMSFSDLDDDDVPPTEVSSAPAALPPEAPVREPMPSMPDASALDADWDTSDAAGGVTSDPPLPPIAPLASVLPARLSSTPDTSSAKLATKLELVIGPESERTLAAPASVGRAPADSSGGAPASPSEARDEEWLGTQRTVARALSERGDHEPAENAWRALLAVVPQDEEADHAIEDSLLARDSYARLLSHLGERASRWGDDPSKSDALRVLRLRRAALLEQRLGLLSEAASELERVLESSPDHPAACGYLADLYERMGKPKLASALLARLYERAGKDENERADLALKYARALADGGDAAAAEPIVDVAVAVGSPSAEAFRVAARIYRACEAQDKLTQTLVRLAACEGADGAHRHFLEAAGDAARRGDMDAALAHARSAAEASPLAVDAQLLARGLEYRRRGVGAPDDARATIAHLEPLTGLSREDDVMRAFLIAEAQDAMTRGAGQKTLRGCVDRIGMHPLLAVGIAERDVKERRFEEATLLYDVALEGDLGGLRRLSTLLLAAADAAIASGSLDKAISLWRRASAEHADVRAIADRRLADHAPLRAESSQSLLAAAAVQLDFSTADPDATPVAPMVAEAAETPISPLVGPSPSPPFAPPAAPTVSATGAVSGSFDPPASPARAASKPGADAAVDLKRSDGAPDSDVPSTEVSPPPEMASAPPIATPPGPDVVMSVGASSSAGHRGPSIAPIADSPDAAKAHALTLASPKERGDYLTRQASALASRGYDVSADELYFAALDSGSLASADALGRRLAEGGDRTGELLRVRLLAAAIAPDAERLRAVEEAARADRNMNLARGALHAALALEGADEEEPPPLAAQAPQPGVLKVLLQATRELEALGLVWRDASHLFAKRGASTIVSGMARLEPSSHTELSRAYELALRLFDVPRVPMLLARGKSVKAELSLSLPPVVTLTCDEDRPKDAVFALGQALALALPENILASALSERELEAVFRSILAAFGPPGEDKSFDRGSAALAEGLWSTISPASQRRLRELAVGLEPATAAVLARHHASRSGARLGLLLTGDLAHALRRRAAELGRGVASPSELRIRVAEDSELAELVRLSILPEYADARWLQPGPASQRLITSRFR